MSELSVPSAKSLTRNRGLSARQRMFCQRLAAGASGAEAARAAGYSPQAAAQQASRMLRNPRVLGEIERLVLSPQLREQAELDRLLSKVETIFSKALRDGQCSPALRAVELEAALRTRGAKTVPEGVSPADIIPAEEPLLEAPYPSSPTE